MDAELLARGHDAIAEATLSAMARDLANGRVTPSPIIVIEQLRQFGDVLHSTLVVRHLRWTRPEASIVWAIMEPYVDAFAHFVANDLGPGDLGPHVIAGLPVVPCHPDDRAYRIAWVEKARTLPSVERAFGCGVGTWGWKCGSIVDAVLHNASIDKLRVGRRPWLPLAYDDIAMAHELLHQNDVGDGKYLTLEFSSTSLPNAALTDEWYDAFVELLPLPVVALGATGDRLPRGAIDGRGTGYRVAKALISGSRCFIGRGSGLSVLAASNGCDQPVVEIVDPQLSMVGIGYRARTDPRHRHALNDTPQEIAAIVAEMVGRAG